MHDKKGRSHSGRRGDREDGRVSVGSEVWCKLGSTSTVTQMVEKKKLVTIGVGRQVF